MTELKIEYVLILVIVIFILHYFKSRCQCTNRLLNSFIIGGESIESGQHSFSSIETSQQTNSICSDKFQKCMCDYKDSITDYNSYTDKFNICLVDVKKQYYDDYDTCKLVDFNTNIQTEGFDFFNANTWLGEWYRPKC